jgi:hypothetical protein
MTDRSESESGEVEGEQLTGEGSASVKDETEGTSNKRGVLHMDD